VPKKEKSKKYKKSRRARKGLAKQLAFTDGRGRPRSAAAQPGIKTLRKGILNKIPVTGKIPRTAFRARRQGVLSKVPLTDGRQFKTLGILPTTKGKLPLSTHYNRVNMGKTVPIPESTREKITNLGKATLNPKKKQAPDLPSEYLFKEGKEKYSPSFLSNYPRYHTPVGSTPANNIPRHWGDMSWTRRTKKEDIDSRIRTRKLIPYGLGLRGIFTWPLTVFMDVLGKIDEQARRELQLGKRAEDKLLELRMRYEKGEISKKEFKKQEAELLKKIKAIKEIEKRKPKKRPRKKPKKRPKKHLKEKNVKQGRKKIIK